MDPSSYPKKSNISTSHQESSDSGVDLSLSTNSSVQYPSTHLIVHRPLSALNEDSSPDEGYPSTHMNPPVRLRFPPVKLGRNRSMEDMLSHHSRREREEDEQQEQHRSSSFSDERKEKILRKHEQQLKRASDGALLEFYETTPSHSHDQHRSINELNNKNLHQGKNSSSSSINTKRKTSH